MGATEQRTRTGGSAGCRGASILEARGSSLLPFGMSTSSGETLEALLVRLETDPDSEEHRHVLMDWLLENDHADQAEWLRLEAAHHAETLDLAGRKRFVTLDQVVDAGFRARVARARVEGCDRTDSAVFEYACPERWADMASTADPAVRTCAVCEKGVRFVTSVDEAQQVALQGGCVAMSPGVERRPGDLGDLGDLSDLDTGPSWVGTVAVPEPPLAGKPMRPEDVEERADERGLFRRLRDLFGW